MTRNLKRVVRSDLELQSVDMHSHGGTVTVRNNYKRRLRLECGHTLLRSDCGKVPARAHCPKCPLVSGALR